MRRSTITLPDDLANGVQAYVERQDVPPTLTSLVQAALREFLARRGAGGSRKVLQITLAMKGSGYRDISRRHDEYLARHD